MFSDRSNTKDIHDNEQQKSNHIFYAGDELGYVFSNICR
jgi:hypothetical protein